VLSKSNFQKYWRNTVKRNLRFTAGIGAGALSCAVMFSGYAHGQSTVLTAPLSSQIKFRQLTGQFMVPLAGTATAGQTALWSLGQWGTPNFLLPVALSTASWALGNNASRVAYSNVGSIPTYELAQNNALNSVCGGNGEFDLFPGMDDSNGFIPSAPLTQLGQLKLESVARITYEYTNKTPPRCSFAQNSFNQSLILMSNNPQYGRQILFYQVSLRSSAPSSNINWCPGYEDSNPQFYRQFCVDDGADKLAGGIFNIPTNSTALNSSDALPRILQILKLKHVKVNDTTQKLNPNPGDWTVIGTYFGSNVWGNVAVTSLWSKVSVSTMPGGQFCNGTNMVQYSCGRGIPSGAGWNNTGGGCFQRDSLKACNAIF
jgi:hypothetical protein